MGSDWTRREFLVRAAASLSFPATSENVKPIWMYHAHPEVLVRPLGGAPAFYQHISLKKAASTNQAIPS
jgi:hypothetical protein